MTAVGIWTLGLALAYTTWLIVGSRLAAARADRGGFFVSGRTFTPLTVALCITGLFSGSSYIAIVELSYRTGISAIWYGVAETVQVLLIALLLVKPLRKKLVVTVTGIIGDRFGRGAQALSSLITGLTFPMYSVATSIAFASALYAVTNIPLWQCITLTALILLAFLTFGGMRSVAFSQTMNVIMIFAMFCVGIWAFIASPGISGVETLATERPEMFEPGNAGVSLIVAWFGTFIVNVPLAQAAFQMSMSARTPEDGQKGLFLAAAIGIPLILLGIIVGVSSAIVVPEATLPLVGIAQYLSGAIPPWAAAIFFVGMWACALGWAGPCQFSGATSLGRDLGRALRPLATQVELIRYTRVALVGLTMLMVLFSLLRAEESAWWNVMAWTLRNGATFAPVLAAFFWPLATRSAALTALLGGFGAGLSWYALSGFSATDFYLGTHPVWVGMIANLAGMVAVTLMQTRWRLTQIGAKRRRGAVALGTSGLIGVLTGVNSEWLNLHGMMGLALFLIAVGIFTAAVLLTESRGSIASASELWGTSAEKQSSADPVGENPPQGLHHRGHQQPVG